MPVWWSSTAPNWANFRVVSTRWSPACANASKFVTCSAATSDVRWRRRPNNSDPCSVVSTKPAMEVVELLNRFFAVIVEEVDRHRGLVNKFEGDAALAVFGAPVALDNPEDDALAATRTIAQRLIREVPECPARIGVAAGQVVAGNVGARERFEYTVIGEPVNEAARLAELARSEPSRALASASTVAAASEREQRFWRLGKPVRLRGYAERVQIASLLGGA